ncbi:MAG: type 2 lantipeptide synthetase LanM family protein [Xanthobacteraceae bacterium]|nr:type 2 lantipeptide synthetase LanM family protein [Xanthobacteraceae bacterium]
MSVERPADPHKTNARLKDWRNAAAGGDETLFVERLARDGLDANSVRRLLGPVGVPADVPLPEWCGVLEQVQEEAERLRDTAVAANAAAAFPYLRAGEPLPFEELFLPFVAVAQARLAASGGSRLSAEVLDTFARELLQRLTEIAARVLAVEFRTFLACSQFADAMQAAGSAGASDTQYRRFIAQTYEDGWGPLFEDYCVAARLLATAVMQWVARVREFEIRLFNDLPEIETTFIRGERSGRVIAVEPSLSDPHDGGRTVVAVEFSGGLKLVYKPRCLGLEKAYFDVVAWINRCGALLPLRTLKVLDRGDHGWVEYAEHRSCASEEETRRYYRRAGHFLCLVHALNGSDFHFENLVACGEHPVPVDLETIYHHRLPLSADAGDDLSEIAARLRASVLATDLLPDPVKVDHQYFDISALARSEDEEGEAQSIVWTKVNTDAMDYAYERQPPQPARNLPKLNGEVVALNDYTNDILNGFEEAYRFLMDKAEQLQDENGPLRPMFFHHARFIHRATALYALILRRALHPAYVRDGLDFGIQLDLLARDRLATKDKPKTWPLMAAEMASLWNMDIPRFTARGDENALRLGPGRRIAGCFVDSAWNVARARIGNLNDADLRWQQSLITGALDVRIANLATGWPVAEPGESDGAIEVPGRNALLDVAIRLAKEIEAKAYRQHNGELGWMVLNFSPAAERYTLQPMENDLYNGRAGVGLFFAALERIMPGSRYRGLASATLAPVRSWIKDAADEELAEFGLGGYAGLSSIVYALTRAGEFLDDDELIADARIAALRVRLDQIEEDESLDVISGVAGAILGLLACHAATGEPKALERAVACGGHLLQRRASDPFGLKTWPTIDKRHLTGFSHGAAGLAYALLQLYKATADRAFYDAALEGIRFEGHAFVPEHNNWRDLRAAATRRSQGPAFSMAWCHGAPGIGLGRIGALEMMDTAEVRRDISAALAATGSVNLLPRDHLCCGNTGLMDTLCAAGERFPDGDWSERALRLAGRTIARSDQRGGFSIAFHNGFFNPSLFQGAAGVGYQMLRLAEPAKIPSVLLLN